MVVRAKTAVFRAVKAAGLLGIVSKSSWRQRRLAILCYHGIALAEEHRWRPGLYVSAAHFRRRLEMLRALDATVLKLDDALHHLYAGTLPPRAVVLTFDDGFVDFFQLATPILEEHGVPATVYLTTFYVERRLPVWNLLSSYVIWQARDRAAADLRAVTSDPEPFDLRTEAGRERAHRSFIQQWENEATADKDGAVDELAACVNVPIGDLRERRVLHLMTPEEVAAVAARGIDVELHTHRHRTPAAEDLFERELDENGAAIARFTGRVPNHVCYPSGAYNLAFLPGLRRRGIRSATTCSAGLATRRSDALLLPRFLDGESVPDTAFEAWVTGLADLQPGRRAGKAATIEG
jgi:peptidoglycan/xylan/chitin deacetylase (PgdA/CDA1 family)